MAVTAYNYTDILNTLDRNAVILERRGGTLRKEHNGLAKVLYREARLLREAMEIVQKHSATNTERNRRVDIENYLLECSTGKRPLPDNNTCRALALRLGTPKAFWLPELKQALP